MKRVLVIAIVLEAAKYLFFLGVSRVSLNEFLSFLAVMIFYITMLPEMIVGGEHGPATLLGRIAMLSVGVLWNLFPAYLISICLPDRKRSEAVTPSEPRVDVHT